MRSAAATSLAQNRGPAARQTPRDLHVAAELTTRDWGSRVCQRLCDACPTPGGTSPITTLSSAHAEWYIRVQLHVLSCFCPHYCCCCHHRQSVKDDRSELAPTRAAVGA